MTTRPTDRVEAGVLTATMTLVLAGVTMATPLLPTYRTRWHLPVSATTALFVVYVVGVVFALLVLGQLADAVGHRLVILIALAVGVVATVVALTARSEGWLIAARILHGTAVGLIPGATAGALSGAGVAAPTVSRLVSAATTTGIAGGLLLGGLLVGSGLATVWCVYLVLLVAATVRACGSLARDGLRRQHWRIQRPVVPSPGRADFVVALIAAAVTFAGMALFAGLAPELIHAGVVASSLVAATAYLLSGLVQQLGRANARHGLLVLALGAVVLAVAAHLGEVPLLLVAAALIGAGNGMIFPATLGVANRLAAPGARAGTISTYYLAMYGGIALPLLGLGFLADAISLTDAVELFAVSVVLVSSALAWRGPSVNTP